METIDTFLSLQLQGALVRAFGPAMASVDPLVRPSATPDRGDFQANVAMSLGKQLKKSPRDVATQIVAALDQGSWCEKVEIAGPGFINLRLTAAFLGERVLAMHLHETLGVVADAHLQTVVVDYSAPNVAKEMHVGHLRSTIIGDCITRVLSFLGHTVIRQNHIGDWGTQFGMLIEYMIEHTNKENGESKDSEASLSVRDLNGLYQQSKARFDRDPAFADRARRRVVLLQSGDAETHARWHTLIEQSKQHFNEAYQRLGVQLTDADIRGESFYNDQLQSVVDALKDKGIAQENDGALCVFPDGFKGPEGTPIPFIVRKNDGGFLYATTDLAALRYRVNELKATRLIYVTDARQKQHFAMLFATARLAGWLTERVTCQHVPFGAVLGDDGKPFKTRAGDTVRLGDLLDEGEERALAVLTARGEGRTKFDDAQRIAIAKAVSMGAIKYGDLSSDRVKDYTFAWDRMLAFDGNTAPYVQNAYVRNRAIFRKAELTQAPKVDRVVVGEPAERALVLALLEFPFTVQSVASSLEPHRLCTYLFDLATRVHRFYEDCQVLSASDVEIKHSRLVLCAVSARTLATGLGLLGISTIEQM